MAGKGMTTVLTASNAFSADFRLIVVVVVLVLIGAIAGVT